MIRRKAVPLIVPWLVGALVAAAWLPAALPPLLDDIYYRGPASDHFDAHRFFNPAGSFGADGAQRPAPSRMLRFVSGRDRAPWPDSVAVVPTRPPARVMGSAIRATWVGHATVLVQTEGLNILTDPTWSDFASPLPPFGPRRVRAPGIRFDDLPPIDVVLVSHNHYDHLDLPTLRQLWARDRPLIVTSLGNDTLMRRAGITAHALDWNQRLTVRPGIEVFVERVNHWSSRWLADRDRALWSGFTVTLPGGNLFFAGDTGLGSGSWVEDAVRRGPVRLALLPIGAYHPRELMSDSHLDPAEAVAAFRRLGAEQALAIHWGTFPLSDEGVDKPRVDLDAALSAAGIAPERFRAVDAGGVLSLPPAGQP